MSDASPSAPAVAARFGPPAPSFLRGAVLVAWLSLVTRLLSSALPGSRSGIEQLIRRVDLASSVLSQLSVLLGSSLLVLLVVGTLGERALGHVHRIAAVPAAAGVLMLVMLASTMGLEPQANLLLGAACLTLAASAASAAVRAPSTRAQGLVLVLVATGAGCRLATRVVAIGAAANDTGWIHRMTWTSLAGHVAEATAVALTLARLRSEKRRTSDAAIAAAIAVAAAVTWGASQGARDGAKPWQVLAGRALEDLTASPLDLGTIASRRAVEALAIALAGVIALWPAPISAGLASIALSLVARPGADVPAAALVLAIASLAAPLGAASPSPSEPSPPPGRAPTDVPSAPGAIGADG